MNTHSTDNIGSARRVDDVMCMVVFANILCCIASSSTVQDGRLNRARRRSLSQGHRVRQQGAQFLCPRLLHPLSLGLQDTGRVSIKARDPRIHLVNGTLVVRSFHPPPQKDKVSTLKSRHLPRGAPCVEQPQASASSVSVCLCTSLRLGERQDWCKVCHELAKKDFYYNANTGNSSS